MEIINIARLYKCRPSELVGIKDAYEAFCLDEACACIVQRIEDDETPRFRKQYSSFKDLYKQYK